MTTLSILALEERLCAARGLVEEAQARLAGKHLGGEGQDYRRTMQAQLSAERDLALARGEPTCMPVSWQPPWSTGAPCPHVLSSGHKTLLLYMVEDNDPAWDGTNARLVDSSSEGNERLAVIDFKRAYGYRFGGPNDEVWNGHPLHGKGLEPYGAHLVMNSPWIAAERKVNSVRTQFRPDRWERLRHYLLLFHDNVFECLAESHECELLESSFGEALELLAKRVAGAP
jgi:hypothetical protein